MLSHNVTGFCLRHFWSATKRFITAFTLKWHHTCWFIITWNSYFHIIYKHLCDLDPTSGAVKIEILPICNQLFTQYKPIIAVKRRIRNILEVRNFRSYILVSLKIEYGSGKCYHMYVIQFRIRSVNIFNKVKWALVCLSHPKYSGVGNSGHSKHHYHKLCTALGKYHLSTGLFSSTWGADPWLYRVIQIIVVALK